MKQFILFLSIVIAAAACKKDDAVPATNTNNVQLSPLEAKKKLLMEAHWKIHRMETIVLVGGDSMTFDITPTTGCGTDNLEEYHSSGFIKIHTGTILCYPDEPALDTLKAWEMPDEQQIIETHLDNNYHQYLNIEMLTGDTLRVSTGTADTNGNQHIITTYINVL